MVRVLRFSGSHEEMPRGKGRRSGHSSWGTLLCSCRSSRGQYKDRLVTVESPGVFVQDGVGSRDCGLYHLHRDTPSSPALLSPQRPLLLPEDLCCFPRCFLNDCRTRIPKSLLIRGPSQFQRKIISVFGSVDLAFSNANKRGELEPSPPPPYSLGQLDCN